MGRAPADYIVDPVWRQRIARAWPQRNEIGGLNTLMVGSILQGIALLMFLFTDGVESLYVVAALFGLFQGGIVPSYTLIVRQYFTPQEAGTRVGAVLMATLLGMALGGWMSGVIFDLTGSYRAAFLNGTAWNLLNVGIVAFLLYRARRGHLIGWRGHAATQVQSGVPAWKNPATPLTVKSLSLSRGILSDRDKSA